MIADTKITDIIPLKDHTMISITGGGGKTTLMQKLAFTYRSMGKRVLMTTSTKIQSPAVYPWKADFIFTDADSISGFVPNCSCSVLFAERSDIPGKLVSPGLEAIKELLYGPYDVVICEADGSAQRPLKIHTERDPVIASFNDWTICVMGSWALGENARDCTFGLPEYMNRMAVNISFLNWYFNDSHGLLKGTEPGRRIVVITKSGDMERKFLDFFEKIPEEVILL